MLNFQQLDCKTTATASPQINNLAAFCKMISGDWPLDLAGKTAPPCLAMNDDTTRAILDKLTAAAARDPLRLPDLQEWVAAFGGYAQIPPEAWQAWDRLHEEYRRRRSEIGGQR
jgi:hypothetical protein